MITPGNSSPLEHPESLAPNLRLDDLSGPTTIAKLKGLTPAEREVATFATYVDSFVPLANLVGSDLTTAGVTFVQKYPNLFEPSQIDLSVDLDQDPGACLEIATYRAALDFSGRRNCLGLEVFVDVLPPVYGRASEKFIRGFELTLNATMIASPDEVNETCLKGFSAAVATLRGKIPAHYTKQPKNP